MLGESFQDMLIDLWCGPPGRKPAPPVIVGKLRLTGNTTMDPSKANCCCTSMCHVAELLMEVRSLMLCQSIWDRHLMHLSKSPCDPRCFIEQKLGHAATTLHPIPVLLQLAATQGPAAGGKLRLQPLADFVVKSHPNIGKYWKCWPNKPRFVLTCSTMGSDGVYLDVFGALISHQITFQWSVVRKSMEISQSIMYPEDSKY